MESNEPRLDDLVDTAFGFEYLNEGAANIVFKIIPLQENNLDDLNFLKGRLLRVQKEGTKAYQYPELQEYWENKIRPLFKKGELVDQCLVKITSWAIVGKLNKELGDKRSQRREEFRNHLVGYSPWAMLVEDMSNQGKDVCFAEFKPKWLAQSPNAPDDALRCRTCARSAQKLYKKRKRMGNTQPKDAACPRCPLALLHMHDKNTDHARAWLDDLARENRLDEGKKEQLWEWYRKNTLLPRLRAFQVHFDPVGPLLAHPSDRGYDFPLAMTLRDCSVFLRFSNDGPVVAKLADLDRKNWDAKAKLWHQTEKDLLFFYRAGEDPPVETKCRLQTQPHPERAVVEKKVVEKDVIDLTGEEGTRKGVQHTDEARIDERPAPVDVEDDAAAADLQLRREKQAAEEKERARSLSGSEEA